MKNNIIPMGRIDDAVSRILRVKFTMGLFENPLADLGLVDQIGSQVDHLIISLVNLPPIAYCPGNLRLTKACSLERIIGNWPGKQ